MLNEYQHISLSSSPIVGTSNQVWYSHLMKLFKTLLTILFISLLSSPSWSVSLYDLVEREDLYYEKFTDVPFNGKVTGNPQGLIKNGVKEGVWVTYRDDGQLEQKGNYKNGIAEGAWVSYWENGQLSHKENYKNGKAEGAWIGYYENGQLSYKGNYKNGVKEGAWVYYYENGQLEEKGNLKNWSKEGAWVSYREDGTVDKGRTGTFKDDVKISD